MVYNYLSVAELQLVSFFCDQGHGHWFALQTAGVLPSRGAADICIFHVTFTCCLRAFKVLVGPGFSVS